MGLAMLAKKQIRSAAGILVFLLAAALGRAEDLKGTISAGVNVQGASLRWFPSDKLSLEGRGYVGSGARLLGLRVSRHFSQSSRLMPYFSLEAGACDFDDDVVKGGTGNFGGAFLGVERFQGRRFSLQFEAGAAYFAVEGSPVGSSNIQSNGVEFVVNAQVNFHLRRPRASK